MSLFHSLPSLKGSSVLVVDSVAKSQIIIKPYDSKIMNSLNVDFTSLSAETFQTAARVTARPKPAINVLDFHALG